MGCCTSRPVNDSGPPPAATVPTSSTYHAVDASSTRAVTSTSPIAHPTTSTQPRPLARLSLTTSHGTTSPSNLSTPRQSSTSRNVALHEHYNTALKPCAPWRSTNRTWSLSQLERERTEFFETRVTGRPEIWGALKNISELLREGDVATAQGILEAAAITTPTGSLIEGCYDEAGNLYRLPEAVLSDPTNVINDEITKSRGRGDASNIDGETIIGVSYAKSAAMDPADTEDDELPADTEALERRREEKGKGSERDAVKIRCRLSDRGGPDVVILLSRTQTVGALARRVRTEGNVSNSARIRIAYLGKMLSEKETLAAQGWKEGHVVNALVTGPSTGESSM